MSRRNAALLEKRRQGTVHRTCSGKGSVDRGAVMFMTNVVVNHVLRLSPKVTVVTVESIHT